MDVSGLRAGVGGDRSHYVGAGVDLRMLSSIAMELCGQVCYAEPPAV